MQFPLTSTSSSTSEFLSTIVRTAVHAEPPQDEALFADSFFNGMALASCVGAWSWPPTAWRRHR